MTNTVRHSQQPSRSCAKRFARQLLTASIAAIIATQANAQSSAPARSAVIEEVTVTAQRRTERSLEVPISITALSAEQLGQGDVQQLSDIMKLTPGLRFDDTGGFAQATIRGVGTAVTVAGSGSNVAVYADGFYSPNQVSANAELLNTESVQVLKGPQGTLFGRNATGGAILVTTREPSSEGRVELQTDYGSYNDQRYQLYATGGPSEAFAMDIGAVMRRGDGYLDNIITGSDTDGRYESSAVRVGVKVEASDRTTVLLRLNQSTAYDNSFIAYNAFEKDGFVYSTAAFRGAEVAYEPHKVSNGYKPRFNTSAEAAQLTIKHDMEFALLTSYTQYREEDSTHYFDFDASALDLYKFIFDVREEIFTQEFLLASQGDSRLQWTTGLFYFTNETVYENNRDSTDGSPWTRNGGSGVTANSIAIFGDVTYALLDNLYLTIGARYSEDEITDAYFLDEVTLAPIAVPDIDDNTVTPRVALRYEPNENSSVYASYSEGFKSGILNVGGGTLTDIEVKPEEIRAYEIGYKYSAGPLMLDLAAYYYDYKDLQVASYVGATSVIENAADSTVQGVEGQLRYAVSDRLQIAVGGAYMEAEYDSFQNSQVWTQCTTPVFCEGIFLPSYEEASGKQMQRSPKFTGTLSVNYAMDLAGGALDLSGTLYHTSAFYFDSSERYKQDGYQLLSLRGEWTSPSERYSIAVYGDNLTDEEYRTQVLPQFYGALSTWGAPRTFGVSLGLNF